MNEGIPSQDDFVYELANPYASAISQALMKIYEKLGRPEAVDSDTGWIMLDEIVRVWYSLFPQEVKDWNHDLELDLTVERSVGQAVKAGGYTPLSCPPRLFMLIRAVFPEFKLSDKKLWHRLVTRYPFLKTTNYKL